MSKDDLRHLAVIAFMAWGHGRPMSVWTSRVVKMRPDIRITFFTSQLMYDRVVEEIASNFADSENSVKARIQVIALYHDPSNPWDLTAVDEDFGAQFQNLVDGKPLRCSKNGDNIPGVAPAVPPSVLLVDVYGYTQLLLARQISRNVKVYAWGPGTLIGIYASIGPFDANSRGELHRQAKVLEDQGMSAMEAAWRVAVPRFTDKLFHTPGMPDVHEYELTTQNMGVEGPSPHGLMTIAANDLFHEADGLLTVAYDAFEPQEIIAHFNSFFAANNRRMYVVGPLVSSGPQAAEIELKAAAKSPELIEFMDGISKSHGEKSLIHIGFGSIFFPIEVQKLVVFVDTLIEQKRPFILSHGGMFAAAMPPEVMTLLNEKIRASGLGHMTSWAPQRTILQHPATGWFVTHCGVNGLTESITAGVPMIAWPFAADQPPNAIRMTDGLDIAYELYEVRCQPSLKPIYRNGHAPTGAPAAIREETIQVLEKAFGEDGKRKRENVARLQEKCVEAWKVGGTAWKATKTFLEDVF